MFLRTETDLLADMETSFRGVRHDPDCLMGRIKKGGFHLLDLRAAGRLLYPVILHEDVIGVRERGLELQAVIILNQN